MNKELLSAIRKASEAISALQKTLDQMERTIKKHTELTWADIPASIRKRAMFTTGVK